MSKFKKSSRAQRPSSRGGRYVLLPAAVGHSQAWRKMSFRSRAVVLAIYLRHDGYNNGRISMSIDELGEAIGSKNPRANGLAVKEAIAFGFIRTEREYSKPSRMAREFRLTFVETGRESSRVPATDDYLTYQQSDEWKRWPAGKSGNGKQMTGYDSEVETSLRAYDSETRRKHSAYDSEVETVETPHVSVSARPDDSEGLVIYQSIDRISTRAGSGSSIWMEVEELRQYLRHYLNSALPGSQSKLAAEIGISGGTLSKFIHGRGLPESARGPLQLAIARRHSVGAGEWMTQRSAGIACPLPHNKSAAA